MESDEDTGTITFGIKQIGKYTQQLENVALGSTVYLDGPYGVFTKEGQGHEPKVVIAGGIGITPFVELIRRFANKNTYLLYANRSLDVAVKRQEFMQELRGNYIDIVSDEKVNKTAIYGRLDRAALKQAIPKKMFGSGRFFICGPPPFMAAVKKDLIELGVVRSRIYTEEFSL